MSPLRLIVAHWPLLAVCALFLLAGALMLDDYGISRDTGAQRGIGSVALDYLAGDGERAFDRLPRHLDHRFYGAAFEAPLALLERIPGLEDTRDVYRGRHLLTHLFFLAGGVFCYLLVLRLFNSRALALVAMVLFLLHPRIYAHSFFNSKDVPFLAAFMIALYLVHRAFRRDTLGAFILCGVSVGLLVNLRVMGLVLFAAVLAMRALDLAFAGSAGERERALLTGGAFALAAMLTYHASLPALWTDPVGRFADAVRAASAFPHGEINLFRGEWLFSPDGPPFDYVPVWVGITTPPATLLLALAGAVALAGRGLRRPREIFRNGPLRFGFLLALLPVVTVAAVVILGSNVYHDWRHLYFLYAPLLLLVAFGLRGLTASARGTMAANGAYALTGMAVAVVLVSMVRIHPHEDNHFTVLTDRTTPERPGSRYRVNYWNKSLARAFADIRATHPSGSLFVALPPTFDEVVLRIPPDERERLVGTRDFRSGERNVLVFPDPEACALTSAPPSAIVHAERVYASTLHCVVEPAAWFGDLRRRALAAEPLIRSVYDVWRDGRILTWVRDGCPLDDVAGEPGGPRFFLHVTPVDADDLPRYRREEGYRFDNLDRFRRLAATRIEGSGAARIDGNCVAVVVLPDYPIAGIRTGQFADEGVLWEADVGFGEAAPDYAAARREALASEPVARSGYDVHLDGRALTYVRDGCTAADADARFFLHVFPADEGDLPLHREAYGFDNLDFTLATRGARLDGNCVAVARLPDYPIATIRTGQYDGTGALWAAEFALSEGE